ncbi:LysR family transcriptional regulator [Nioella sp.]|uniref:LysR family transcriptional regulator n=1 Tax=Nioella sp. TaxID=1912091 RepID=UPI003B5220B3
MMQEKLSTRLLSDKNLVTALEVFVAIAETRKVTRAAKLLGITQSAASQQLASLEEACDARLVDRSVRPLRLTQAGELCLRHAQRILNSIEDLATSMRHEGPRPISVLRVGMLASIATTLTPPLVNLTKADFGVEDLTLHAGQSGDHEALLRSKRADLVVTSNPFYDMDGLERHDVLTETFLLVLPESYRGPSRSLSDILDNLPLVRFAATTSVGRRTEQHLRRLKLAVPRVIQADRSSMVTACVAQGLGFTILTPSLLIDGFVEQMPLSLHPLPAASFSRSITVVARAGELGDLPEQVATMAALTLTDQITRQMGPVGREALNLP